jgi:hypothetical protein
VRLQNSYNATITRPNALGNFKLNFNQNLQLTNFSKADYKTILIDIERDGTNLTRSKDFSWRVTNSTKSSLKI